MAGYAPVGHDEAEKILASESSLRGLLFKGLSSNTLLLMIGFYSFWIQWIASVLIIVGAVNLKKPWCKKICFAGIGIFLLFLIPNTCYFVSEILLPVKIWRWAWISAVVLPLVAAYIFTIFIVYKLKEFKIVNMEK